jgi:alpha-amylase
VNPGLNRRAAVISCVCGALAFACSRGSKPGRDVDDHGAGATASGGAGSTAGTASAAGVSARAGATSVGGGADLPLLPNDTQSGVFVHLFEWRWADVARECESFLGPKGFTAVQVSPPSEHALLANYGFPWWQRYQTVSYQLESRSGTRADFIDMVSRCRAAGVGIYVDAVLNHTTAQTSGAGSAGTKFTKYVYPDLFAQPDFHAPVCQIKDTDYTTSAQNVQRCELVSLADLDTGSARVQAKLAGYLSDLLQIGVRGFRLDAAKHVAPADLAAILAQVTPRADEAPYYFLEVIDYGDEAVRATDYLDVGGSAELDITEFKYKGVGDAFLARNAKNLATLKLLSEKSWSLLPSERAVAFIDNHDTQRGDASFYQDGAAHELASVFMLAWPYGYPSVMSSYGFDRTSGAGRDVGPPSDGGGSTHPVYELGAGEPSCVAAPFNATTTQGWICEHRLRSVANMVGFRKTTAGAAVANVWDNGVNQLAFSRGDRGFLAINHEPSALRQSLATGMAAGRYCDVLSGDFTAGSGATAARCTGNVVEVDGSGNVAVELAAETALAIHANAKL